MTAEVVVMNKSAIALAADSKVTIGGARMAKTYDTVNKLFTLSKIHPVGVMIYGNADFMSYPWETVIKMYRSQRGTDSEATIQDWADNFIVYLRKFGNISAEHKDRNLKELTRSWFSAILDEVNNTAYARGIHIGSHEYVDIIKISISDKSKEILEKDFWISKKKSDNFIKKFGPVVDNITNEFFSEFEDPELLKIAENFISLAIFLKYPSPLSSGVVIAGFGDDEIFPTYVSLECDGYLGDDLKLYQESVMDISRDMTGAMRAFAQGEMVQRFMAGVDPHFGTALMTAFGEILRQNCLETVAKYGMKKFQTPDVEREIAEAADASMMKLLENVDSYTTRAFSGPILEMISLLPKDELANLAESLVALTSLKRRVSSDVETVGGAIDVALISKSDGFVWIKRKYYFSEELNPQFNRNYMNDVQGVNDAKSKSKTVRRSAAGKTVGGA